MIFVLQISVTEHDREKQRLTAKVDELNAQLIKSESAVSELAVCKAELVG
jgi:hypothetical protein